MQFELKKEALRFIIGEERDTGSMRWKLEWG